MDLMNKYHGGNEHRVSRPMKLADLINAIKSLESNGIIAFEDFKELPYNEIKNKFFGMIHPTQMKKAIIKIHDEKEGRTGMSSLTRVTKHYKNGEWKKTEGKTDFF